MRGREDIAPKKVTKTKKYIYFSGQEGRISPEKVKKTKKTFFGAGGRGDFAPKKVIQKMGVGFRTQK